MFLDRTYKYLLIQFLELPNNVEKYVYIPSTWVKVIECENNTVKVAYPQEEPSITEQRVKNDEGCDEDWKLWAAKVMRGTDFYEEKLSTFLNNKEKAKGDNTTMGPSPNGSQTCEANTGMVDSNQRASNKDSITIISHYVVKTEPNGVNKVIDVSSQVNMNLDDQNRILNNLPEVNNHVSDKNSGDENHILSKDLDDSLYVKTTNYGSEQISNNDSNHVLNDIPGGTGIASNFEVIANNINCDISPDKYVQIEKNLAAMEGHTEESAEINTEIPTTTCNENASVKTLPQLSKPLKKRSLDSFSQQPKPEAVKKPKVAEDTCRNLSSDATTNSYEKLSPIRISKTVSGFTINPTSSKQVAPSQRHNTDVVDVLENVCNELSKLNGLAKNMLKYCKELTVSFDENATSCEKMYSYVDDLVALYGEDGNYGGHIDDSDVDSDYSSDDDHRAQDKKNLSRSNSSRNTIENQTPNNSSRWTLKYPSKVEGTMELMPGSGIYVHTHSFRQNHREAKSPVMLARRLCVEIFTDEALRTCSFSGLSFKNSNMTDMKPGLNSDGTRALLDFVRQESVNHPTWPVKTDVEIRKNINVFLYTYRNKIPC